jgi:hypothetical protein
MNWLELVAAFFAGMFLANAIPHFVHGVSGDPFPTPFSRPPGKGLSSATVNVAWALVNMAVGYWLFKAGHVASGAHLPLILFLAGAAAISVMLSVTFAKKQTR